MTPMNSDSKIGFKRMSEKFPLPKIKTNSIFPRRQNLNSYFARL